MDVPYGTGPAHCKPHCWLTRIEGRSDFKSRHKAKSKPNWKRRWQPTNSKCRLSKSIKTLLTTGFNSVAVGADAWNYN